MIELAMPVCHAWLVTDDDRRAVAGLAEFVGGELQHARRTHDLIWRWQQGRCAVCGDGGHLVEPGRWGHAGFVIDHDHITALVRGWLCRSCNTSEPHNDDEFARYRDQPPAVMLGVAVRYEHPWYGLVDPQPWRDPANFRPAQSSAHAVASRYARALDGLKP